MQQTIHGDCTELTAFVCEHLSVCLYNPFSRQAVCCIYHCRRSTNKISYLLGQCFTFFLGRLCKYPSSFASFPLQIELNILKLQVFRAVLLCQESGTKVNICNFYSWYLWHILEVVLQFLYLKHMQQKCSPCAHLKLFSILHLKHDYVGHLHGH